MVHLKRQNMPKNWPIVKKGNVFIARSLSRKGIPLLIVLRDLLKIAQTRKEVKKAIQKKHLLINNKFFKDEKIGMTLFDTLSIIPSKTYYRLELSEIGKFELKQIKEEETNKKIVKVIDKRVLPGKKIQLNLSDGRNFLIDPKFKCRINDSVLINFKDKKIEKCLPLKENANAIVFAGKHSGKAGQIEKIISKLVSDAAIKTIEFKKERKMAILDSKKEKINVLIKQIMAIE